MCGIFGWYLKPNEVSSAQRAVLAAILGTENDGRGGDSWGYWEPQVEPVRGLGELVDSGVLPAIAAAPVLCAHTRFATAGSVKVPNAHPFTAGTVTGAHNGAVWNHAELNELYPNRRARVDSQHLIYQLAEQRPFDEVQGYGTLMWTDLALPGSVMLARMLEGELRIARVGAAGWVWSSTAKALHLALSAAGLDGELVSLKESRSYRLTGKGLERLGVDVRIKGRPFANLSKRAAGFDTSLRWDRGLSIADDDGAVRELDFGPVSRPRQQIYTPQRGYALAAQRGSDYSPWKR